MSCPFCSTQDVNCPQDCILRTVYPLPLQPQTSQTIRSIVNHLGLPYLKTFFLSYAEQETRTFFIDAWLREIDMRRQHPATGYTSVVNWHAEQIDQRREEVDQLNHDIQNIQQQLANIQPQPQPPQQQPPQEEEEEEEGDDPNVIHQ